MNVLKGIGIILCMLLVIAGLVLMMCEPAGWHTAVGLLMFAIGLAPAAIKSALSCDEQSGA